MEEVKSGRKRKYRPSGGALRGGEKLEGKKLDRQKLDYRRGNGGEKMKKNRKWRSIAKGEAKGN